ncbi:metallothiol transferase FosB [Armatimonadota bacterium]|nr:metallothiol transferase FosB [Armatimonadota bacterium]
MQIQGLNHITFSVSELERSLAFYERALKAKLLFREGATAYLDLGGIWIALNEQRNILRYEIYHSYTHTAFTISPTDGEDWKAHLTKQGISLLQDRERSLEEGQSLYFTDPDGHLLELHTGSLAQRLSAYNAKATIENSTA